MRFAIVEQGAHLQGGYRMGCMQIDEQYYEDSSSTPYEICSSECQCPRLRKAIYESL